jgi:hypothetical protein
MRTHLKSAIRRAFGGCKWLNINSDNFIRSIKLLSNFNSPSAITGTQIEDSPGAPNPFNMISIHEELESFMLSVYYTDVPHTIQNGQSVCEDGIGTLRQGSNFRSEPGKTTEREEE